MPPLDEILRQLDAIANRWWMLAICWHALLGLALLAITAGFRPGKRAVGMLLAIPLASVSALAWLSGNPFNGTAFAILAAALAGVAFGMRDGRIRLSSPLLVISGLFMVAFGWVYPHFIRADSWVVYLYASPFGLIPCPTLSAIIGIALMIGGLNSRAWTLILSCAGAFYGLVGWLRLGVTIDVILLLGAAILSVTALSPKSQNSA